MTDKKQNDNPSNELAPPISVEEIDRLRRAGYVIVPIRPTDEMLEVGAISCFCPPAVSIFNARQDAAECWAAMLEIGCL